MYNDNAWAFVYMRNVDIGCVSSAQLDEIWESLGIDKNKVACASSIGGFLAEFIVRKDYADQFANTLSLINTPEPLDSSLLIYRDTEYTPLSPYTHLIALLDQQMPTQAQDALSQYSHEALTRRWSALYHSSTDPSVRKFIKRSLECQSLELLPAAQGPTNPRNQKTANRDKLKSVAVSDLVHYRTPNQAILSHDHLAEIVPRPSSSRCIAYADGAYLPDRDTAGIGVYFLNPSLPPLSQRLTGYQSNARAEIHAIVLALTKLSAVLQSVESRSSWREIWVCSDSRYAVNGVNVYMETWEQSSWLTNKGRPVANRRAFQMLRKAISQLSDKGFTVFIHHLPAHAGISGNEIADMLAKAGALL
ncbi:Ribonuclease H1 [Coemansia sp. RSA 2703]|nr:Ribonuclease H1 [Coemansia sp. RSA 2703]